jgi:hypothetical protein
LNPPGEIQISFFGEGRCCRFFAKEKEEIKGTHNLDLLIIIQNIRKTEICIYIFSVGYNVSKKGRQK